MICPDCGHDNIAGIDHCEACGQALSGLEGSASEMERSITAHPARVLVPKKQVTVPTSASVREAVHKMVEHHIGCLLVEEGGDVVGIFTERDVLNRILPDLSALSQPVADFMTPAPVAIDENDSLAYALHMMAIGGYRHLPVTGQGGKISGIVSARDLLRFLSVRFADIRDED